MENSKKTDKSNHGICNTKIYPGDNNEMVCVKIYQGDWGHWDEKPEQSDLESVTISQEIIENKDADTES
ncbi:hypothetical protein [Flavobacterium defluvii]|uniref:Uncharacterized protein n=1 Tax=Flavobacterium defluvii TaxID=370979 RepID=A0A1M5IVS7_9FLAO|nr:hypothetical protein [Flavobacterium defluvii]SHG32428.1 hypothetical protein SAMN05443663_102526 [Flavobacterium defluvii]